ncbi:unknown [Clostridium sp. CAG:245]|nr:unknown [Clostridium sp. CAG:245]
MKDILITVISILLTVVIIICMVKGLTVGSFRILSISNIKQESLNLDNEVDELNNLKNATYKKKIDDLQTATKDLTTAKQKYLDLASVSSDEEIQEANLEQTYAMEFLWNKVGSYATKEGVTLKWDVSSTGVNNKYTLNFTTTGSYVGVISYIYALENDSDLAFRIENFKMTASGENVTATFTVNNVAIKAETISSTSSNNTNEQANTNTTVQ